MKKSFVATLTIVMIIAFSGTALFNSPIYAGQETVGVEVKGTPLEIAQEFFAAAREADLRKMADLSCKVKGPYVSHKEMIKEIDSEDLTVLNTMRVLRVEKTEIDPENLKIAVLRVGLEQLGVVGFWYFVLFKTPKGYKVCLEDEAGGEYPLHEEALASLQELVFQFYTTNKINLDSALKLAENMVKSNPEGKEAHLKLGNVYKARGWHEKAMSEYKKVVMLDKYWANENMSKDDLIAVWTERLHEKDEELRFSAAKELYWLGASDVLVGLLEDENKEIRYWVAEKLAKEFKDPRAVPVLREMYRENPSTRFDMALFELGGSDVLAEFLKDENKKVRSHTIRRLKEIKDKQIIQQIIPELIDLLEEPYLHARDRADASLSLSRVRVDKRATPGLIGVVRYDYSLSEREEAARYLVKIGKPAVPGSIELLESWTEERSEGDYPMLLWLEERSTQIRTISAVLGDIGDRSAVPVLKRARALYMYWARGKRKGTPEREAVDKVLEKLYVKINERTLFSKLETTRDAIDEALEKIYVKNPALYQEK